MPFAEEVRWGDKNIQEQRYVATYICRQLERFTDKFTENGPYTARAGHLAHLRSDFRFVMDQHKVGRLLETLHPTPAVCGLPKEQAFRFILDNEHQPRSYYSGFMGPLFVDGQTNLFVTLRCMQLMKGCYRLYAGGGLLKDSVEEQEWQETEIKLDTMRSLLIH
jgi:isochorismate synthase